MLRGYMALTNPESGVATRESTRGVHARALFGSAVGLRQVPTAFSFLKGVRFTPFYHGSKSAFETALYSFYRRLVSEHGPIRQSAFEMHSSRPEQVPKIDVFGQRLRIFLSAWDESIKAVPRIETDPTPTVLSHRSRRD